MAQQILRLGALAIGGFMVLSVLARVSISASRLPEGTALPGLILIWLPVAVSLVFAYLIYRYARNVVIDEPTVAAHSILDAGLKLLGIYLFVEGVRYLVGAATVAMVVSTGRDLDPAQIYHTGALGLLYLCFSFVLVKKTSRLARWLNRDG